MMVRYSLMELEELRKIKPETLFMVHKNVTEITKRLVTSGMHVGPPLLASVLGIFRRLP